MLDPKMTLSVNKALARWALVLPTGGTYPNVKSVDFAPAFAEALACVGMNAQDVELLTPLVPSRCKWMPSPAEVIEVWGQAKAEQRNRHRDVIDHWNEIVNAIDPERGDIELGAPRYTIHNGRVRRTVPEGDRNNGFSIEDYRASLSQIALDPPVNALGAMSEGARSFLLAAYPEIDPGEEFREKRRAEIEAKRVEHQKAMAILDAEKAERVKRQLEEMKRAKAS